MIGRLTRQNANANCVPGTMTCDTACTDVTVYQTIEDSQEFVKTTQQSIGDFYLEGVQLCNTQIAFVPVRHVENLPRR